MDRSIQIETLQIIMRVFMVKQFFNRNSSIENIYDGHLPDFNVFVVVME